ncbi:undecaprenyl-diphosphatase [Motilibacter rhizosphaerae]|uniref:Undecaprenyl-diphosphatase n=1 Tax=Motilibacter rhizosphaerae TaxID=598652 RepID=A0A4Q7NSE3_9ACTN|nr:phosphatase PAP2 family protein [Motilibacter rhizosphaerae]RZS90017.1 undecaprenyl-diphosphatase [Motilibacter rhizosphaerae]
MSARVRVAARLAGAAVAVFVLVLVLGELLTHVLVHGWVGRTDDAIERALLHHRTPTWDSLTYAGTQLAEPTTIEVALVVLVVALAVATRRVLPPLFLALTVGVESGIYFVASTFVPRDRPSIPRLGVGDPHASYPSGHVAASICFYGGLAVLALVLTRLRWLQVVLTGLAVVLPPAVGLCRMYRGFHHLSDVLAGGLLGLLWLGSTTGLLLLPAVRQDRASVREALSAPPRPPARRSPR